MALRDVFCQDKAIGILQKAFAAGRVPHAYIFAGPQGVGKFKTATEYAKLLLCRNPVCANGFFDNCAACQSCRLLDADAHPDFYHVHKELSEFTEDGKDKTTPVDLPIDVIREFLIEKVPSKPALSQRKVFIVSEAERLNVRSQNALLKVLEEPGRFCCIILLCTRMERLLPTTKSRCQIIRFGPVDESRIIEKLQNTGLDQNRSKYFARLAAGSLGTALDWAKLELAGANLYHTKQTIVDSITNYQYANSLFAAEQLLDQAKELAAAWSKIDPKTSKSDIGRRALGTLVTIIVAALQDAMRLAVAAPAEMTNFDQPPQIDALAAYYSPEQAAEKINACCQALQWADANVNEKLILEHLLLSLRHFDRIGA